MMLPGMATRPETSAANDAQPDPESTRMRLMLATERQVAANGIDGMSVRDIARDAGTNLSAIDYHFGSKIKLVLATLGWRGLQGRAMRERQLAPFEAQETIGDLRGLLRAILECHYARPSSPGQPTHMFFIRMLLDTTPEIVEFFREAAVWFRKDVFLLQRALPELSFEEASWRYYAIMGLTHLNDFDDARLAAWSDGKCVPESRAEVLDLIVDCAVAIAAMPARANA